MNSTRTKTRFWMAWLLAVLVTASLACNALTGPFNPAATGTPEGVAMTQEPVPSEPGPRQTETRPQATRPAAATARPGAETEPAETASAVENTPAVETTPAGENTPAGETASPGAAGMPGSGEALTAPAEAGLPDLETATRYEITAQINYAQASFQGSQTVHITNNESVPLDTLNFRLLPNGGRSYGSGSLSATNVQVNGQPVEMELSTTDSVLAIPLPAPIQPGASLDVSMDFSGQVPENFGRGGEQGYGIYNFSDGVLSLADWYPILAVYDQDGWNLDPVSDMGDSVYSDISFYSVDLTVPGDVQVVSTGVITGQEAGEQGTRYQIESGPVREFFMVMSPNFEVVEGQQGDTQVNSYYLAGQETGGRAALEIAEDSLQIFNEQIGPYPYTELDVVAVPMRYAAGVEYPGLILVANYLYEEPLPAFFEMTVAHEVAHQWWYNVVGNDVFDSPWLDEGLTTYTSALYYEFRYGDAGYSSVVESFRRGYGREVPDDSPDNITDSLSHFETNGDPNAYSRVVYLKSALFFDALRQEIGDEAFFAALEDYYAAYQYEIAQPENLLDAFEQTSGENLDAFYAEWLE